MKIIPERLEMLLISKEYTQTSLANKIQLDTTTVSKLVNGKSNTTLITLLKISQALDVDVNYLIDSEVKEPGEFKYSEFKNRTYSYRLLIMMAYYNISIPQLAHHLGIRQNTLDNYLKDKRIRFLDDFKQSTKKIIQEKHLSPGYLGLDGKKFQIPLNEWLF